jgi:hypothetical protein
VKRIYWHSFLLDYNVIARTVDIIDSASGDAVLKGYFPSLGQAGTTAKVAGRHIFFRRPYFRIHWRTAYFDFFYLENF